MDIEFLFYAILGNWQMMGLAFVGLLLLYRVLAPDYFEKMLRMFPWRKHWVLLAVLGIVLIQLREIQGYPLMWIAERFPAYSLAEQLVIYVGSIHFRSILFYAIMIFYLWRKMDSLPLGLISGCFWIGVIELTFIPQHYIWLQFWMGWSHYLPFILLMVPFIFERKRFRFPRTMWIWFAGALVLQYGCLFFTDWSAFVLDRTGFGFAVQPMALPHLRLENYLWELGQHLMKTLFTVAGCYISLIENNSIRVKKGADQLESTIGD